MKYRLIDDWLYVLMNKNDGAVCNSKLISYDKAGIEYRNAVSRSLHFNKIAGSL